jgi:hypothetical protein
LPWNYPFPFLSFFLQNYSKDDRDLYAQLIQKAKSVIHLSGIGQKDEYQLLGDYLVDQMDYLIAIWNGLDARGPGGTGDVVQNFRKTRKPLAWLRADNMVLNKPIFLADSLQQGSIQYENW